MLITAFADAVDQDKTVQSIPCSWIRLLCFCLEKHTCKKSPEIASLMSVQTFPLQLCCFSTPTKQFLFEQP